MAVGYDDRLKIKNRFGGDETTGLQSEDIEVKNTLKVLNELKEKKLIKEDTNGFGTVRNR